MTYLDSERTFPPMELPPERPVLEAQPKGSAERDREQHLRWLEHEKETEALLAQERARAESEAGGEEGAPETAPTPDGHAAGKGGTGAAPRPAPPYEETTKEEQEEVMRLLDQMMESGDEVDPLETLLEEVLGDTAGEKEKAGTEPGREG